MKKTRVWCKVLVLIAAVLCLAGPSSATDFYFGQDTNTKPGQDDLWSNSANWSNAFGNSLGVPGSNPTSDVAYVAEFETAIVNYAAPAFYQFGQFYGSLTKITSTGSLTATGFYIGQYGQYGTQNSEVWVDGGSLTATLDNPGSPSLRVGASSSATATLTVTNGGTVTSENLQVGIDSTVTAKVNLYDGTIHLTLGTQYALYLYSWGKMEMKSAGTLILDGDQRSLINGYIANGYIYTNEPDKVIEAFYDSGTSKTTVVVSSSSTHTPVNVYFGYDDSKQAGTLWSNPNNWCPDNGIAPHNPPFTGDTAFIVAGEVADVNYIAPAFGGLSIRNDSLVKVLAGGSLDVNDAIVIGGYNYGATGGSAELRVDGGTCYVQSTYNTSPRVRVGDVYNGVLTIKGGVFSTNSLIVPNGYGVTGTVKLYGGTLELRQPDGSCLLLNYSGRTGGTIDVRAPGKLTVPGLQIGWLLKPAIDSGVIYSSDPNTILVLSYDGEKTTLQGVKSYSDLNRDNKVNLVDFSLFANEWMQIKATDSKQPNPNRVVFAPAISPITVDGAFGVSEWSNASEWAEFGKWYPHGQGLSSTTKARYAWNDSADRLYIAIESTEPNVFSKFQVGGLQGEISSQNGKQARPIGCWQATEIHFQYNGSSVVITNPYSDGYLTGTTTGIIAAQTFDGTTLRLEISTPIYSDWTNDTTAMALSAGMDIYTYVNILSALSGTLKGDSQCATAGQVPLYESVAMENASAVRLLSSLPATCADMPSGLSNYANFAGDCSVKSEDLAIFVEDWLKN